MKDGRVEIDNNQVENAIRPTAIGKNNWLFIGEAGAGQTSAILFTLIEACRRRQIDPWEYLRDALTGHDQPPDRGGHAGCMGQGSQDRRPSNIIGPTPQRPPSSSDIRCYR